MNYGNMKRPCYNCNKRHVESGYNCHSDCPEYKAFEKANRERLAKISLKRDEEAMMHEIKKRAIIRTANRDNKKKIKW